ncbi:hypothetical protein [Rhizobium laguerreae]|uniref:hypothetical protein n=1 Tax=Rhizobium laguerreae TaxID=1076926 RepID=UPI001C8FD663|nr:hypothetical protein [Rhizobium laguerreae]MBY3314714.1 hypothetical protein [Rhizobium laguerreae]
MLRKKAPKALKDTASKVMSDLWQLWQEADQAKTATEWMEGVCNVHRYRDDTRTCEAAAAALEGAIYQIGVAAGHIDKLMRREP